jgi:hypothetical protein
MKITYTTIGPLDVAHDSDGAIFFAVAAGNGKQAVTLQNLCWELQSKRKYTAAARANMRVEQVPGYVAAPVWAEGGMMAYPPLDIALETLAYHIASIRTDMPSNDASDDAQRRFKAGCGIQATDGSGPVALCHYDIVPSDHDHEEYGGPWGVWATVTMRDGSRENPGPIFYQGNRAGATLALARHYAPVIAYIAAKNSARLTPPISASA